MKQVFIDLETGGLKYDDPILQMSWIIKIDGKQYPHSLYLDPMGKYCDPMALKLTGINLENPNMIKPEKALNIFIKSLEEFINPNDPKDLFYIIGYNIHAFDQKYLRVLFTSHYKRYNDYFWNPPIDVMLIAAGFCMGQRQALGDFKQTTVAKSLGIKVDEDRLHDSTYDVLLSRDIFNVLEKEMLA